MAGTVNTTAEKSMKMIKIIADNSSLEDSYVEEAKRLGSVLPESEIRKNFRARQLERVNHREE